MGNLVHKTWNDLEKAVGDCFKCPIALSRKVFGEGDRKSPLVLVGEGPGKNEVIKGRPFIGWAGQVLREAIPEAGMRDENLFITNTVLCRPTERIKKGEYKDRIPTKEERDHCSPFLGDTLELIQPKIVVALGLTASKVLLQFSVDDIEKMTLSKLRIRSKKGEVFRCSWGEVIVTYHPSFIRRSGGAASHYYYELVKDLVKARDKAGIIPVKEDR